MTETTDDSELVRRTDFIAHAEHVIPKLSDLQQQITYLTQVIRGHEQRLNTMFTVVNPGQAYTGGSLPREMNVVSAYPKTLTNAQYGAADDACHLGCTRTDPHTQWDCTTTLSNELPGMWEVADFTGGETDNDPNPIWTKIGIRLQHMRTYYKLSQEDVSARLGIPRPSVSEMERGNRKVTALELYKLAQLYRCPMEYFFVGPL